MFGTHPASALTAEAKAAFGGLKTADYDPIYRFEVPLTKEGAGRDAVIADYRRAVEEDGVQGIPTVIVPGTGQRVVGLADLDTYRRAVTG